MKWAIVFYAVMTLNGATKEHISWGITFNHHEECMDFYARNKNELLEGVRTFAENNVDPDAVILELGCAHATADFENSEEQNPLVTLRIPLWLGENT